ncbi:OsmC family peroxiredoxin [Streptomyces achromogenes]|uniref:OsmC family peroxiredoxin n=1 Tax=Streptomyces achromogenes TaxID=67255 RepID=UPI00369FE08D
MAVIRTAGSHWEGTLQDGRGTVTLASSNAATHEVSWPSRAEEPAGRTSPEELIAAAQCACYNMSLTHTLESKGHTLESVDTKAEVTFELGAGLTRLALTVRATVPGISEEDFRQAAETAKANCPVTMALSGIKEITLDAALA